MWVFTLFLINQMFHQFLILLSDLLAAYHWVNRSHTAGVEYLI
jgi:hypothetical protein